MSRKLVLAPGLFLPLEAATETLGILAMRGAGKSNTAKVMAEQMYAAGIPFVAVDPVGKWWGLRSSKDGRGPGIPIPILGGRHGDIPLERGGGTLVADLIVENRLSCILDLFQFSEGDKVRFLTDFCRRLYRKNEEPLHLFMEEADDYCPQVVRSNMAELVGAWEDIVRRGRANGLGCTMITQRSQGLNKAVLEQIGTLIVMRTPGPKSRKAIAGWIEHHGLADKVLSSLPSLKTGEAWVWSPEWLGLFARFQINLAWTFDSAATPKMTKSRRPPTSLADVDLAAFQEKMAATIEQAKQTDPRELRARISKLDAELQALRAERPQPVAPPERVEVSVMTGEDREFIEDMRLDVAKRIGGVASDMRAIAEEMERISGKFGETAEMLLARVTVEPARRAVTVERWNDPGANMPSRKHPPFRDPVRVSGRVQKDGSADFGTPPPLRLGERKMLLALATRHPLMLSRSQLALLSGFSMKSSTFRAYFGTLKREGLVIDDRGSVYLSQKAKAGLPGMNVPAAPMTPYETREMWMRTLRKGEREILSMVVGHGEIGIDRNFLGESIGSAKSSTFRAYLGTLRRNGLVRVVDGLVYAAEELLG